MEPFNNNFYNQPQEQYPQATHPGGVEAANIRITSLMMIGAGTYNQQYLRPYATDYNHGNKNALAEMMQHQFYNYQKNIATGQTGSATQFEILPEMVAGAAGSFLAPSVNTEATVNAPNGWDGQRMRFTMTIEAQRVGVGIQEFVIMGYTDHYGIGMNGSLDPRMEFYMNAIFELQKKNVPAPYGGYMQQTILSNASQILANERYNGEINSNVQYRMRPEDVIAQINIQHVPEMQSGRIEVIDSRSRNTGSAVKSSYSNANANSYLASVLGGLTSGMHQAELTNRHGKAYELGMAAVLDNKVQRDPFMRAMNQIRGQAMGNKFTYQELMNLDPNVDRPEVSKIFQRTQAQIIGMTNKPGENLHSHTANTAGWNGTDRLTQMSAKIVNTLPELMMDLLIRQCSIHSTNNVVGSMPSTIISNTQGVVPNVDMSQYAEQLKHQFHVQLLQELTFNNQLRYDLTITADVMGEIWISIDLEGYPMADFVAPAFANSLITPVTTRNQQNLATLAKHFSTLQQEVFPTSKMHSTPQDNQFWTPSDTLKV